jgi:DNA-directed RNA polymerase subunit L/DNA-directed RNA polymerase alpha subunit
MSSVFSTLKRLDKHTISFTLSPTKYQYANTLRRAIQSEVPCLGFRADIKEDGSTSDVKIFKNSTPMSNEMLADRIGLLPIAMPKGVVDTWDKDSIVFRLAVKNETDDFKYVTASDFECFEKKEGEEPTRVPNTDFFHPDPVTGETCLIAVLKPMLEGQPPEEIALEAYASIGIGREHTRFNPTSQCSYGNTLDSNEKRVTALWLEWLREHKKVDPKELEKDQVRKQNLEKEFRSLEIQRCFLVDDEGEPYSFNFTVESIGTMGVSMIVARALLSLIQHCDKYTKIAAGDLPDNVDIRPTDKTMKGFDIYFQGEDHTLGNLLQTWIAENKVDRDERVTFIGYCIPHPLRDEMKMCIGVEDGKVDTVRKIFAEAAESCAKMFAKWYSDFVSSTGGELDILKNTVDQTVWEAHKQAKIKSKVSNH